MSRQLLLLRHAKSSWDSPGLPDHERPLAPRGRRAAAALRDHLAEAGLAPDLVLCSSARRTIQTWEEVASAFPPETVVEYSDGLYGATTGELLRRLRRLPDAVGSVMLVGHNPAIKDLATALVGSGHPELQRRLDAKFPTGAVATLAVPPRWADLRWGTAELSAYVTPRQLTG